MLRSLGSPEVVYGQIATTATKYSTATTLEAVDSGPGFATIIATATPGFPRAADHCAYTSGLLSQPTVLFGLPPATVHHEACAAYGAPVCEYHVTWLVETDGGGRRFVGRDHARTAERDVGAAGQHVPDRV